MIQRALYFPDPRACFKYLQCIHITNRKFFRALWSWETALKSQNILFHPQLHFWENQQFFKFTAIKSFLSFQWSWFNVRCIPLIPEHVLNTYSAFISPIENFLERFEVERQLSKLDASWTIPPHLELHFYKISIFTHLAP